MKTDHNSGSDLYLWLVCSGATLGGLLFGYDMVVVSGVIPYVVRQFDLTPFQLGLLVSCVLWGCAAGAALAGIILDAIGRKKVLIFASIIMLVSALFCSVSNSTASLIAARLLGGFGCGLVSTACPLYISEMSPEKSRGRMVTIYHFSVCLGIVICVFVNWAIFSYAQSVSPGSGYSPQWYKFVVGEYWRSMFLAEAFPALLFVASTLFLPETPRWLVKKGRISGAKAILSRINGSDKAQKVCTEIETTVAGEKGIRFADLFTRGLKKPLILSILICVFAEACGISAVLYYGPQLFEGAGLSLGDSLGGFSVIALVLLFFNFAAMYFVEKVGRRKLLLVGSTGSLVSLVLIGTCYLLGLPGVLIVIFMTSFVAFFASSIGPVKFVIISEIFPNTIRGRAIAVGTVSIWLTSAAVAQLFPMMRETFHTGYIFYLFALDLAALILVVLLLLPETKGRTIEEIERSWLSGFRAEKG